MCFVVANGNFVLFSVPDPFHVRSVLSIFIPILSKKTLPIRRAHRRVDWQRTRAKRPPSLEQRLYQHDEPNKKYLGRLLARTGTIQVQPARNNNSSHSHNIPKYNVVQLVQGKSNHPDQVFQQVGIYFLT